MIERLERKGRRATWVSIKIGRGNRFNIEKGKKGKMTDEQVIRKGGKMRDREIGGEGEGRGKGEWEREKDEKVGEEVVEKRKKGKGKWMIEEFEER